MTPATLRLPFLLLTGLLLAGAARASVTETVTKSFPLAADGTVQLDNVNGDIEITAWDKAEVSVVAEKKAKSDEDLHRVSIEFEATPENLSIKTKHAKGGWFRNVNASVKYKLMVPAGARLNKIASVNSDITVTGVQGRVILDTVNGRVRATGLAADARLESVNGDLSADFASVAKVGTVKLNSVNGRAEVTLPKGAGAHVNADSVNGRVNCDQPIKLSSSGHHSLRGQIHEGGPDLSLETVNGNISVHEK